MYRARTNLKGFFVKKIDILALLKNFPDFMTEVKQKITVDYIKMLSWLNFQKKQIVEHYDYRADFKQVLVLKDYDMNLLPSLLKGTFIRFEDRNDIQSEKEA